MSFYVLKVMGHWIWPKQVLFFTLLRKQRKKLTFKKYIYSKIKIHIITEEGHVKCSCVCRCRINNSFQKPKLTKFYTFTWYFSHKTLKQNCLNYLEEIKTHPYSSPLSRSWHRHYSESKGCSFAVADSCLYTSA